MPTAFLEPTTPQEAAFMLFDAGLQGRRIVPRGGATKLAATGHDAATDAWMSTLSLRGALAHDPGDLVASVPAGMTLHEVNWQLSQSGQWLPLDPPDADRATIGGIVATNDSGPQRHRYGAPRDLILGVELAMTDGRVAHAGGRVVKNVAGYDLSRLICGSEGRLAVMTSVTFKLAPLAPASATLVIQAADVASLCGMAAAIAAAPSTPSALEIGTHPDRLLVRFDSTASVVDRMAAATVALLAGRDAAVSRASAEEAPAIWDAHERNIHGGDGTVMKLTLLPSQAATTLAAIAHRARELKLSWAVSGRIALGVFDLRVQGESDALRAMVEEASTLARAGQGRATVRRGSPELRHLTTSRHGDERLQALERAVIQQFDPRGVLSSERQSEKGARI